MNENARIAAAIEDASTFIEFMNLPGETSEVLRSATHPEEQRLNGEGDYRMQIGVLQESVLARWR